MIYFAIIETITNILGSIDKKIEINKKKIEKLTALSLNYFLYFERFSQDNIASLDSLIKNVIGGDWGKDKPQGIYTLKVNCIRGADIAVCKSNFSLPPERYINAKNTAKLLDKKSLIIEISGGSHTQSTGRIMYVDKYFANQFASPIICSNFCKAIQLNDDKYIYWFFLKWEYLYHKGVMFNFEGKTSGIKNFLFDIFISTYKTTILSNQYINQFNGLVEPIFNKIQKLINENNKLINHREMILPLLMNGQAVVR